MLQTDPPSKPLTSIPSALSQLHARVLALESAHPTFSAPSPPTVSSSPPPALDPFATRMQTFAVAAAFTRTLFTRCPAPYYTWPLEQRRALLCAATTSHLTKSIVLENTRLAAPHDPSSLARSRYLCCVVPYTARIDSDALRDAVRATEGAGGGGGGGGGARAFNYRLAEDCEGITGYQPNAVTPLAIRTPMPVVVASQVARLDPDVFWLGGGEVSLKWRVTVDEFVRAFQAVVLDFAVEDADER